MTIDKAIEFLVSYHGGWTSWRHEQLVRKELGKYSPDRLGDLCEQIVGMVNQRFSPDVADVRAAASALELTRMGRHADRPPVDPDELEEWYYGAGGIIDQAARRIVDRDEPGNDTAARLKREEANGCTSWGAPNRERPELSPAAQKYVEALRERLEGIADRHPDPEARDRRLEMAGVINAPIRPHDVAPELWEQMSDANKQLEIDMRRAEHDNIPI